MRVTQQLDGSIFASRNAATKHLDFQVNFRPTLRIGDQELDSVYTQVMVPAETKTPRRLLMFPAAIAMVLMSLVSMEINAQDENETCPCFSYEEVESTFLKGLGLAEDEGMTDCSAQDYSVELNAEVVIWDMEYTLVTKARVDWFDFDPGGCEYIDTSSDPAVERNVRWPHPAPETTARACLKIIFSVIKESDTSGKCSTYP